MRDSLNLDELRQYITTETQRRAKLQRRNRTGIYVMLGTVILAFVLNVQFWIFSPLVILFMTGMIFSGWFLYHRIRLNNEPFHRARQIIERVLPADKIVHVIRPTARIGIEFAVFLVFTSVDITFLHGYQQEGIPIPLENVILDLQIAPQWAIPFLLGWGVATIIVAWWMIRLSRNWSRLSIVDRRKAVSRHFSHTLGIALFIVANVIIIVSGLSWLLYGVMLFATLLLLAHRISWYFQSLLLNRFVNPHFTAGNYDLALQKVRQFLRIYGNRLYLRYSEAISVTFSGGYAEAEKLWLSWLEDVQSSNAKTMNIPLLVLSHVTGRQKRYEDGLMYAVAAIEVYPEMPNGYVQLATHYIEQEIEPERALEMVQFAFSLQEKPQPLWIAFHAVALAYNGRLEESVEMLQGIDERQLSTASDKSSLAYYKAQVARLQGNISEAREYCEQAIKLDPQGDGIALELLKSLDE